MNRFYYGEMRCWKIEPPERNTLRYYLSVEGEWSIDSWVIESPKFLLRMTRLFPMLAT